MDGHGQVFHPAVAQLATSCGWLLEKKKEGPWRLEAFTNDLSGPKIHSITKQTAILVFQEALKKGLPVFTTPGCVHIIAADSPGTFLPVQGALHR